MSHIFSKFLCFIILCLVIGYMAVDVFARKNHVTITINPSFIDDVVRIEK